MGGKEFRRHTLLGGLPRYRLRAVLAELESGRMILVRPGAAGTIEPVGFVGPKERQRRIDHAHFLAYRLSGGSQGTPAPRRCVICLNPRNVATRRHIGL